MHMKLLKDLQALAPQKKIKIKEQQSKWRNVLNPKKVEKISKIIEKFGLDIYECNNDKPLKQEDSNKVARS